MFIAVYAVVFFACWAMMVREGIWSNAITLLNIVFSGLVAFGFYPPLAIMIDEATDGVWTYLLDFLLIWALFVVAMLVTRIITDAISKTRLRLKHPLDAYGGPLVGALAAWVMVTFVMATLHTSPLDEKAFSEKLIHSEGEVESNSAFSSPDLAWLRLVEQVSPSEAFGSSATLSFSDAAFVKIYRDHRAKLEKAPGLKVRRGGG